MLVTDEWIDWERTSRAWKVRALLALFAAEGLAADDVAHWTEEQWAAAAERAGVHSPHQEAVQWALSLHAGARSAPVRASLIAHAAPPPRRRATP